MNRQKRTALHTAALGCLCFVIFLDVQVAAECRNTVACWPAERAKCRPVPLEDVHISGFLGRRVDQNLTSVMAALESPVPRGFEARAAGKQPPPECNRLAADSDLYKWLEGACYVFARTKDAKLRTQIDRIADCILTCQQPDGFINTQVPPNKRFDLRVQHDLYLAGHFFEAAVAHRRATGRDDLLRAACRWADYLITEHKRGNPYFEKVREHPEYELGFLRLGRTAGRKEYVDFAATLATQLSTVGPKVADVRASGGLHAVRTGYLLAGMADIYLETGRRDMIEHLPNLWRELVDTRMYLTGAIGSRGEGISETPFDLPLVRSDHNDRHLGETCACVSMIMFTWRMHAIRGGSECFDVIEQALYNHYLGAISLDQLANFYYNPIHVTGDLAGKTDHGHRPLCARCRLPAIHSTACCMPNAWRFLGALPEYVFSRDADGLFINLYTSATVDHTLPDGRRINLSVTTDYPHDGKVVIRFEGERPTQFKLRLRVPAWSRNVEVQFGGSKTQFAESGDYLVIDQMWNRGDELRLTLPMPVRMIVPDPRIEAQADLVGFARGPLVYCLEKPDVDFPVEQARVGLAAEQVAERVHAEWREELLAGIHVVHVPGLADGSPVDLPLIPWYARANRGDDSRWVVLIPRSTNGP